MTAKLTLTRDQLASFLQDDQQIRQFEKLFSVAQDAIDSGAMSFMLNVAALTAQNEELQARVQALETAVQTLMDVSNTIEGIDAIQFTSAPVNPAKFRMQWNAPTYNMGCDHGVNHRVGLQQMAYCGNNTGATIPAGIAVAVQSASGGYVNITPASNVAVSNLVGITVQSINVLARGFVVVDGLAEGIDASGAPFGQTWGAGDSVYLGATVGTLTNIPPVSPLLKNRIGVVVSSTAILVQNHRSIGLNELNDVDAGSGVNGSLLIYDGAFARFRYNTLTAGPSINITNGSGTVTIKGSDLTNDQAVLLKSSVSLTNGGGALLGTLATSPIAGPPTKWVPIVDNGVTRYIPAW
jgi:hypothetical protein